VYNDGAVDPIPISDEIFWRLLPRKCLGYLTRDPLCRRVRRNIDLDPLSAVYANDDERIKKIKADGWDDE
jgi:hypothetical protein